MAITKEQVRAALEPDEPSYREAAERFGSEALPFLEELLDDPQPGIAAKATSLAGMIDGPEAARVLQKAAESQDPVVRVAAAGAARDLSPEEREPVLIKLIWDGDVGVQKTALKSVPREVTGRLRDAIRELRVGEDPVLSELRDRALDREASPGGRGGEGGERGEGTPRLSRMPGEEVRGESGGAGAPDTRETGGDGGGGDGSRRSAGDMVPQGDMPAGKMTSEADFADMPGGAMGAP